MGKGEGQREKERNRQNLRDRDWLTSVVMDKEVPVCLLQTDKPDILVMWSEPCSETLEPGQLTESPGTVSRNPTSGKMWYLSSHRHGLPSFHPFVLRWPSMWIMRVYEGEDESQNLATWSHANCLQKQFHQHTQKQCFVNLWSIYKPVMVGSTWS